MSDPNPNPGSSSATAREQSQMTARDTTDNPLFGASPPNDSTPSDLPPPDQSSHGITGTSSFDGRTSEPLFGASPPPPPPRDRDQALVKRSGLGSGSGASPMFPARAQAQAHPLIRTQTQIPSLPTFLRRLTFLLSLLLGASSLLAASWSLLFLPLLHASFSARRALVEQQLSRMTALVKVLKEMRDKRIYRPVGSDVEEKREREGTKEEAREAREALNDLTGGPGIRREASVKEIHSRSDTSASSSHSHFENRGSHRRPRSTSASPNPNQPKDQDTESASSQSPSAVPTHSHPDQLPHLPLGALETLSTSLKDLATSLDSTSTTRTSLISTLESYTSSLHRELFVARPHSSFANNFGGGAGLGTLGANLSQASASESELGGNTRTRGEEWDMVRKEVRAIKGLLLNRRAFVASTS